MTDLRVDYEELGASRDALNYVCREFVAAAAYVDADRGIWGHPAMETAMERFVDDWSKHRERLQDNMTKLHELTQDCIDTFTQGDSKLAAALAVQA